MMRPTLLALLCFGLLAGAAAAQGTPYAAPTRVSLGKMPNEPLKTQTEMVGFGGGTMTPDGRVLLAARYHYPTPATSYNGSGWLVTCLLPERVRTTADGAAEFAPTPLADGAWSKHLWVEQDVIPPTSGSGPADQQFFKQWVSMCPDPDWSHLPCPFPSDANGNPGQPGTASGDHDTYRMLVFGADIWGPRPESPIRYYGELDPSPANDWHRPTFVPGDTKRVYPIGMRRLCITVKNPRTAQAEPVLAALSPDFEVLEWTGGFLGDQPVLGIEPSISRDGRLLLFQGHTDNQTRRWNSARTEGNYVMYSFNPTPGMATRWSRPEPLADMFSNEQATLVDGVPFADLYPIARAPMTMIDGTSLVGPIVGAYPWMTLDATDVVISTMTAPGEARHYGMAIVGQSTGYGVRYIDGPLNPDRFLTKRIITTGTGRVPGFWRWGDDAPDLALPYTRVGEVIPLLSLHFRQYGEISTHECVDGEYLLAWDMNEVLEQVQQLGALVATKWQLDTRRTGDSSGHCITGALQGRAYFPEDAFGATASDSGVADSGQAIYIEDPDGAVTATHPDLDAARSALSAECWVKDEGASGPFSAMYKAGAFEVDVNPGVGVRVTLHTVAGTLASGWVGYAGAAWNHVAFTYDGIAGEFIVYSNGRDVHRVTGLPPAAVLASPGTPFVVGPDNRTVGTPLSYARLFFDQVRLSITARSADEIQRAAFALPGTSHTTLPVGSGGFATLPLGLDVAESHVPLANVPTVAAIDLGERLFHDPGLSGSGTLSCADCHQATLSFTDGIAERPGFRTGIPLRNAPTVLNRLFSRVQMLDGRAASLEDQALLPLFNPEEMDNNPTALASYLSTSYAGVFQQVYGPTATPSIPLLQNALASYMRGVVTGGSPADHFEAGSPTLTPDQERGRNLFFGKARCFGCHSGSNYTDERMHVSVVADPNGDLGRFSFTGRYRDMFRFKTPTLRNLVDTAPYFHRGQARDLPEVIEAYDRGGAIGVRDGIDPEIVPLHLTGQEKRDLEEFLRTLTGPVVRLQ
ncbi:MAG: c-type cytochrome [Planctomycetes bacterium]|nr:c-type cytochrome [Planctomycetota bacterium]